MRAPRRRHSEQHRLGNLGWLRAAVPGANDGIVSTASLGDELAVGATIPLVVVIATPRTIMPLAVATIALTALTTLAALGGLAARAGGAGVARGVARYVLQRARDGDDVRRRPRARLDRSNALR